MSRPKVKAPTKVQVAERKKWFRDVITAIEVNYGAEKLTLRDLAILIEVSPVAVFKWASGKSVPTPEVLIQIAKASGLSLGMLLAEANYHRATQEDLRREYKQVIQRCF